MQGIRTFMLCAAAVCAVAASGNTHVKWSSLGNDVDSDGKAVYVQRFEISGDKGFAGVAFNQFARSMKMLNPVDTLTEIVPGYYQITSPRFAADDDKIVVDIQTRGSLRSICYAPDGVHLVMPDGSTAPAEFSCADITSEPRMWLMQPSGKDVMPYGDMVYDRNVELQSGEVGFYDVIPSFKKVTFIGGHSTKITKVDYKEADIEGYRASFNNGVLTIESPKHNYDMAVRRLSALDWQLSDSIPNAVIEDYPDFDYRAVMIDIARNYQTPVQLERVLRLMARYGLNVLHYHFADDEAWRLEIPGMPELTEIGGRRGYTFTEDEYMAQIFRGDGNPASDNTSNGYFTREDFIRMLRVAKSLGIKVLPEIESPGHARVAIKAMEKRYRETGDDTYRLIDPADTSVYTSAQAFHDNVMNPALPGPVKFMTYVVAELQKMYKEAGVELPGVHIGGDEVARGAWKGSPIAQAYMKERGMTNERDLHLVFIRELVENFAKMGVKVSGWQEIAVGHSEEFNEVVRPHTFSVNCWSTLGSQSSITQKSARSGYPTVLSNVNHFYLDMCYSPHPYERGLSWGGYVDEFDALHGYAAELCPVEPEAAKNIIGVSGQLFAETIRSAAGLETLLLPKMTGLAERGWNSTKTYSDAHFNAVINSRELPWYQLGGYTFHVRQPGIKVVDGKVHMNTSYATDAEVRYTTDGSEPTRASALYQAPIEIPASGEVRARIFIGTHESVVSILYVK